MGGGGALNANGTGLGSSWGGAAPDIHAVTAEEEEERKFSIFDVVLPVVDSEVRASVLPWSSLGVCGPGIGVCGCAVDFVRTAGIEVCMGAVDERVLSCGLPLSTEIGRG